MLTVIYYTAHTEKPSFEDKIIKHLIEASQGFPIISVSQKPIDLGKNICVGEVGVSAKNAWRQLRIGAMAAETEFVCLAESDQLHPREFFEFEPQRNDVFYTPNPLYVVFPNEPVFKLKHGCEGCLIVGREFLIDRINSMFRDDSWGADTERVHLTGGRDMARFDLKTPVVMFRTPEGITKFGARTYNELEELEYWGKASDLIKEYYG